MKSAATDCDATTHDDDDDTHISDLMSNYMVNQMVASCVYRIASHTNTMSFA